MTSPTPDSATPGARERLRIVIFEADTPIGKAFDVALLVLIIASIVAVMLESVQEITVRHGPLLRGMEWVFTGLFTAEYLVRLAIVERPWRYARSFFGIVDLLAILPTYLSLVFAGSQSLLVVRALRLLRVFRVFKMARYLGEANVLVMAMRGSMRKIVVFVGTVLTLVLIIGTLMYLVEGERNGFEHIPAGIYWAVVTVTTVGYGDITPHTVMGKALASCLMLTGYGIIAVPTGIVTAELLHVTSRPISTRTCRSCAAEGHDVDAKHCKECGEEL